VVQVDTTRQAAGRGSRPGLRASDAERDAVAAELREHFAAGRLDQSEFGERVASALRARTAADLDGLLADLPPRSRPQLEQRPVRPSRRLVPLVPLLLVALVVAGFAAVGGHQGWAAGWPLWWLVPLVALRLAWRGGWRRQWL
jgi:Domain of unknown function (DUF1707)